uniref:Transposase-associated domain-containing protein n=1 Tax=Brassica oleracea TaxID=3712 RepID=A0A3P6BKU5_BRAOL|nr:unnamed protein product [Brassica oleracea]
MLRCLRSSCNNNKVIKEFDVWTHLYMKGFSRNYKVWYLHGKPSTSNARQLKIWKMAEDDARPAARLRRSSVSSSRASGSSHDSVPAYIPAPAPSAPHAAPHAAAQQDPGVMPVHLLVQQPGREHLPFSNPTHDEAIALGSPSRKMALNEHQPMMYSMLRFGYPKWSVIPNDERELWFHQFVQEFNCHSDLTETVRKKFNEKAMDSYTKQINAVEDSLAEEQEATVHQRAVWGS